MEGAGLRSHSLNALGYQPIRLKKAKGDARYSGTFRVNGKPVDLLIDSGANSTDLNANLASRLGIQTHDGIQVVSRGALGRPVESQIGLGTLTAGPISASPFPFMISPVPTQTTATSRYDGQLGLDALSGLGALVDLSQGSMWVPGPRSLDSRGEALRPLGRQPNLAFDALQLRRTGRLPHLNVRSRWQNKTLTWIVDTGAEVTVLAEETARRLGIAVQDSRSRIIDASGDQVMARVAILNEVVFNRLVVTEFQVAVIPLAKVRESFRDSNGRPIDGIIGMDFLEKSGALLDSSSKLLYVGSPAPVD